MSSVPTKNRLPKTWRLGGEEFPDEPRFREEFRAEPQFHKSCEPFADFPDAAVLTALDWDDHAKSYVELISRIHTDLRMERMAAELRLLAKRVRGLEEQTANAAQALRAGTNPSSTCSPFAQEQPEAEADAWDEIEGIEFRSTEQFERDLERLPAAERGRVVNALNTKSKLLVEDRAAADREFRRPHKVLLHGGLESSLSEARMGRDLRVLLTVDEDPIFCQVILTLLRVVRRGEMKRAFDETLQLLYPNQVLDIRSPEK